MPLFSDVLKNTNSNAPSLDLNDLQVRGVGVFADKAARDLLDATIQTEGYLAIMKDTDTPFIYTGGTWTDSASWSEVKGLWDEDANGINYQAGNVGIGTASVADYSLAVDGKVSIDYQDSVIIGNGAGSSLTTGVNNAFVGRSAGNGVITGGDNVALGYAAGMAHDSSATVVIGYAAGGSALSTGGEQTIIGNNAGTGDISGATVIIGSNSAQADVGYANVVIGRQALGNSAGSTGQNNVIIGYRAQYNSNALGSSNVIIGSAGLAAATSGFVNIVGTAGTGVNINGYGGGGSVTLAGGTATGTGSFAAGPGAIASNSIAIGWRAGRVLTTGDSNTLLGRECGQALTTGSNNWYSGYQSGRYNISGSNNVALGDFSGYSAHGDGNIFLGYQAGYNETGSNKLYIANSNTTTPLIYGDFSTSTLRANGTFEIGDPASTGYAFPTATGTLDQVLKVDANGDLVFGDDLNGLWTADTNGITYTAGNVGIGTASSATRKLVVTGGVRLETFMEMDANNDGNGNIVIGTSSNYSALTSNNCIVIGNNNTIGASNPTQTIVIGRNKDVSSRSYRCTDIGGSGGSTYIDGSGTTSNQVAISADAGSHGAVIVIDGQVNSDYAIAIGGRAGAESVTVGNSSYASHYANYSAVVGRQIARFHTGGDSNVLVGYRVAYGTSGSSVSSSVLIGAQVANSSTTNINNVMVGYRAGYNTTTGSSNVFLGYQAGYSETTSNKLYIANSSTTSPLIYGEFDNDLCRVNGNLQRVIYGSTETTTSGTIHIRDNTDWATQADATDNTASTGLLGIALGSAANAGLVLFGDVDYTITGNVGIPVYLDTTAGGLTTTAPTGSGNIVRVMGYIIGTNKVFFNPSNDWLEIV